MKRLNRHDRKRARREQITREVEARHALEVLASDWGRPALSLNEALGPIIRSNYVPQLVSTLFAPSPIWARLAKP